MRKNSESFGKYPHKICRPIRKSGYLCRGAEAPFHKLTDMYRILTASLFAALTLPFGACDKGADTPPTDPEATVVRFTIRTEGLSADERFETVKAYLFDAEGRLGDAPTLTPDAGRTVELTLGSEAEAYFLTGAELPVTPGMSRSDFLQLTVGEGLQHDHSAPEFMAAHASFAAGVPSTVTFRRRTARIDLDTRADASIRVTAVTLHGVPAVALPFREEPAATDRTLTYTRRYAEPLAGQAADLFRVYPSAHPVEVSVAALYGDTPVQISATLPALQANRIYTLTLRNAGAALEGSFVVAPWEEGETVVGSPDTEHRILLDPDRSAIPADVQADFAANTLDIPAAGATLTLAFRASMPIEIAATEGLTEAVRIGDPAVTTDADGSCLSAYPVTVAPQGRGRLGYEVVLHLKYALYKEHYDYVLLRVAPSSFRIETVTLAGCEWMAFNARSRDLEDQIYCLDGCTVEEMYRTNWLACTGGLFQFGRLFMYEPWQGYNPSNNLGGQQQDVPWRSDSHMPCPEGYRVPTPAEFEALLPSGTTIPGSYRTATGEAVRAVLLTAEGAISTPTGVTGTPRYVKLTAESDGRSLILPLAGSKGDKSTTNNPSFGARTILWTNDNTGMAGGWARTHAITYANGAATARADGLQMEGFASLRCVKKQ